MPVLSIELTEAEHDLLTKKAGSQNLGQITRIALDQYFARYVHTAEPLPPLDLGGRVALLKKFAEPETDPRKPQPPEREEKTHETDEDYAKKMRSYEWQLNRYEAEKAHFDEKKRQGTVDQYGCVSCKL